MRNGIWSRLGFDWQLVDGLLEWGKHLFELYVKTLIFAQIFQYMYPEAARIVNPLAILKPEKQRRRYTLEEYLRREERSAERCEYYDGIITRVPMAKGPHNIIAANTVTALNLALRTTGKDYTVFSGQQKVYLPALNFGLYSDALAISEDPVYWDKNQVLLINPLVIVEVLSRRTGGYDRGEKFAEYKTLSSFREYVLIEQDTCKIETRFREEPDLWREKIYTDLNDEVLLRSIGCKVAASDLYRKIIFV
jgi:Uma2 family endonuclease